MSMSSNIPSYLNFLFSFVEAAIGAKKFDMKNVEFFPRSKTISFFFKKKDYTVLYDSQSEKVFIIKFEKGLFKNVYNIEEENGKRYLTKTVTDEKGSTKSFRLFQVSSDYALNMGYFACFNYLLSFAGVSSDDIRDISLSPGSFSFSNKYNYVDYTIKYSDDNVTVTRKKNLSSGDCAYSEDYWHTTTASYSIVEDNGERFLRVCSSWSELRCVYRDDTSEQGSYGDSDEYPDITVPVASDYRLTYGLPKESIAIYDGVPTSKLSGAKRKDIKNPNGG